MSDSVNRPTYYVARGVPVLIEPGSTVAGMNDDVTATGCVECHDIIEAMGLHADGDVQQAFQYLWRAFRKNESPDQDIAKAHQFLSKSLHRRGLLS